MPACPAAVVTKCVLDQLIKAPAGTVLFLCAMKLMQKRPQVCLVFFGPVRDDRVVVGMCGGGKGENGSDNDDGL